jgi:hypothetical protein
MVVTDEIRGPLSLFGVDEQPVKQIKHDKAIAWKRPFMTVALF